MFSSGTVDYLTITGKHKGPEQAVCELVYESLKHDDVTAGLDEKPSRALGYTGQKIGTMFLGHNNEGTMFRASGALAAAASEIVAFAGGTAHVTRIDCQLTWEYTHDNPARATQVAEAVRAWQKEGGLRNPPSVRLIQSFGQGDTCTIGARSSEVFIRVYDKSREQQVGGPPWLWRFEVELKGERAQQALMLLRSPRPEENPVQDIVDFYCRSRGIPVPWTHESGWAPAEIARPTTDAERKLAWLESHVKSSVQYLLFKGHRQLVLEALGLDSTEV